MKEIAVFMTVPTGEALLGLVKDVTDSVPGTDVVVRDWIRSVLGLVSNDVELFVSGADTLVLTGSVVDVDSSVSAKNMLVESLHLKSVVIKVRDAKF